MSADHLWYLPNDATSGHRGDTTTVSDGWGTLDYSTDLAQRCERSGWGGALIGTGWGRPDTLTVATALAARTSTFRPLVAARPGYWSPAQFAAAGATLDALSGGRMLVNVVSGQDDPAAYGDAQVDQPTRYARTAEFMQLVRRLWTEEDVTFHGEHYRVDHASVVPRPHTEGERRHPTLYFGGASPAAERTAAAHADVQLFWGEPLADIAERISRLRTLERDHDRVAPLRFGLRITTVVRETTEEAWRDAEAKVDALAGRPGTPTSERHRGKAVGQQRLLDLHERGDVLDTCLYTRPGTVGGGGAGTTWLVGSPEDVALALAAYHRLGVEQFIPSDTPYREEVERVGRTLLPRLRELTGDPVTV
ncbi:MULTISPECIES: LLM class flavin-dependent oxidoreductase [unclassified Nocardioides]|uniref:LLM class flavin-dependent oxidoreductase n=1 Tax=unclassified Nocardioides TaxID=2615069 RepID=UPI003014804F